MDINLIDKLKPLFEDIFTPVGKEEAAIRQEHQRRIEAIRAKREAEIAREGSKLVKVEIEKFLSFIKPQLAALKASLKNEWPTISVDISKQDDIYIDEDHIADYEKKGSKKFWDDYFSEDEDTGEFTLVHIYIDLKNKLASAGKGRIQVEGFRGNTFDYRVIRGNTTVIAKDGATSFDPTIAQRLSYSAPTRRTAEQGVLEVAKAGLNKVLASFGLPSATYSKVFRRNGAIEVDATILVKGKELEVAISSKGNDFSSSENLYIHTEDKKYKLKGEFEAYLSTLLDPKNVYGVVVQVTSKLLAKLQSLLDVKLTDITYGKSLTHREEYEEDSDLKLEVNCKVDGTEFKFFMLANVAHYTDQNYYGMLLPSIESATGYDEDDDENDRDERLGELDPWENPIELSLNVEDSKSRNSDEYLDDDWDEVVAYFNNKAAGNVKVALDKRSVLLSIRDAAKVGNVKRIEQLLKALQQ